MFIPFGFNQGSSVPSPSQDIQHYYEAINAKDSNTTIWTDTGNIGNKNLTYNGSSPGLVSYNSSEGGWISKSQNAQYVNSTIGLPINTFSWRMWIRPTNNDATRTQELWSYGKVGGSARLIALRQTAASSRVRINFTGVNNGAGAYSKVIDLNVWYMITITADLPNNTLKYYGNNGLLSTQNFDTLGSGTNLTLFDSPLGGTSDEWKGDFKLLAGYSRVLSLTDVQDEYAYDLANNFG